MDFSTLSIINNWEKEKSRSVHYYDDDAFNGICVFIFMQHAVYATSLTQSATVFEIRSHKHGLNQ